MSNRIERGTFGGQGGQFPGDRAKTPGMRVFLARRPFGLGQLALAVAVLGACGDVIGPEAIARDVTIAATRSAFGSTESPSFTVYNHRDVPLIVNVCSSELQVHAITLWLPMQKAAECDGIPVEVAPRGRLTSIVGGYRVTRTSIVRARYFGLRWADGKSTPVESSNATALVRRK